MSEREQLEGLKRAARAILFDRATREVLSQYDRMAFRQLEKALRNADATYDIQKDKLYKQWNEEDERKNTIIQNFQNL